MCEVAEVSFALAMRRRSALCSLCAAVLGIPLLLAGAACGKEPKPPQKTASPPSTLVLTPFDDEEIHVRLPGAVRVEERSEASGARSLVAGDEMTMVSLCVIPATSLHLVDRRLQDLDAEGAAPHYVSMFPSLKGESVVLEAPPKPGTRGGLRLKSPERKSAHHLAGGLWRVTEASRLAFALVLAPSRGEADALLESTLSSLVVKSKPLFPPEISADRIEPTIPDSWILGEDSLKKRYWAREDGQAFFMLSYGTPNPLADGLDHYGITPDGAKLAIETAEGLSGRSCVVDKSCFLFEPRLFLVISRASGRVRYKGGDFVVEMDLWHDPRLGRTLRAYAGGRTPADLEAARAIRRTMRFE